MRRNIMVLSLLAAAALLLSPVGVSADAVKEKSYLSLGADLKPAEKEKVLSLLDVEEDDLDEYTVVTVTNQDEHTYLDDYLSPSVIGSRALSSVLIEKEEKNHGIEVTTKNITHCTPGMYQNALTTAGITDAEVVVAGPFEITGTAALVGAMKAYEEMSGEKISEDNKDAATNELIVTGELAEELNDSEKAEQFLAFIKEEVLSADIKDKEEIYDLIDRCAEEMKIEITESQRKEIADLMEKINGLDLDIDQLKKQASDIYDKLSQMDLNTEGFFDKIMAALGQFLEAIRGLFN